MSYLRQAISQYGVVTVPGASGVNELDILLSDDAFDMPSIKVIPMDANKSVDFRYAVTVYIDGEVVEHHEYTTLNVKEIPHMAYPGKLFDANLGLFTKAGMKKWNPGTGIFTVRLTNFEADTRSFIVIGTYELCSGGAFRRLTT